MSPAGSVLFKVPGTASVGVGNGFLYEDRIKVLKQIADEK